FEHIPRVLLRPESYALIFSLIFVNLFDTTATLLAVGNKAGLLDERGKLVSARKAVYADAFGAVLGGVFGSSTVTSYAESTIGIEAGARTGLSAATAGVLFLLSVFLYPLFSVFSAINVGENFYTPVTSLALVAVGATLFSNLKDIDWSDKTVTFSAFAMILFMVLTYSLSDGIGFGIIVYVLMKVFSGKKADVSFILYLIAAFFLANFAIAEIIKA
ncbi:MAG: NCS2 family permease, partial [Bacilli bacterium]